MKKESEKKPKLPKRKFGDKVSEGFFKFFNDDNKLN